MICKAYARRRWRALGTCGGIMAAAKEKLVITGMGAVTPIGCGVDKYWNSLVEGRCGIDTVSYTHLDVYKRQAVSLRRKTYR